MQRYFVDTPYQVQESYQATKEMYHHMVHVMRMKVGSQVYLAFNDQQVIMAQISEITPDTLTLEPQEALWKRLFGQRTRS